MNLIVSRGHNKNQVCPKMDTHHTGIATARKANPKKVSEFTVYIVNSFLLGLQ